MWGRRATRLSILAAAALASAAPAHAQDRYSLAGGCYTASTLSQFGPLRFQATDLGTYLLYTKDGLYLTRHADGSVTPEGAASEEGVWRVRDGLTLEGAPATFSPATGCPVYPEVDVNVTGAPSTGATSFGEVRGLLDAHTHMMAFEFLGGRAHCGKPWDPYGAPYALVDCPDHYVANGSAAVLENALYGDPARQHDPVGWPTFKDWPNYKSLTHEQSYYKWLERAWRAGERVFVNLLVENKVLCEVYPYKKNDCDEMASIRLQNKDIHKLQDYIDAQNGGPGKGWFRIVTDPFQARKVINEGKLAVILGIEVSEPFGCQISNDQPQCTVADIDKGLDEVYGWGVRDMEIINKFDNALAGVAGDNGETGTIVNNGNRLETGHYWQMKTCTGPAGASDKEQTTPFTHNDDVLISNAVESFLPQGAAPVYPPAPHCNERGLTSLGEHLIRRMMAKQMIVDPDHLSVLARDQVLSLLEAQKYSGVVSSHSWSTVDAYPRIYRLGGVITPYAGASTNFAKEWKLLKPMRDPRFYWGIGWGADQNGFGAQGGPRVGATNPVGYPFKSFDGKQTIDRGVSGRRVWDINKDGVAQYGLYPDWVQDLRMIAGDEIVDDLAKGPEAYLQMWERAEGIAPTRCQPARARVSTRGIGRVRVGVRWQDELRSAGQPSARPARVRTYCLQERDKRPAGEVKAVFTQAGTASLVASTGPEHVVRGAGPGDRVPSGTRAFGHGVRRSGRYLFGVRKGRIAWVAVASGAGLRSARVSLRLAGLLR